MRLLAALAVFTIAVGAYLLLRRQAGCCVQFPGSNLLNAQLDNPLYTVGWASRIPTALVVLAQNLALCVFPYRLAADYSYAQTQVVGWASASFLAWGVVLAAAIAGAILVRRRWPGITFGVLWFLLALLPASNLVIAIGTVRAERLLYLPSLGICLAVAELLLMVVRARPRAGMALIVVLLGSFAVASLGRNIVWRDMKTIVAATVRDSPRSARAHYNQAVIYARAGDYARAIPGFQTAINLYPQFELARLKLGDCYRDTGDLRAAEENYRLVFEQDRRNPEAAGSLAAICEQLGDAACVEEARRALTRFQQ